jgi:hypothetical protein
MGAGPPIKEGCDVHVKDRSPDIARTTLQLIALGVLIASSFRIVRPFLVALTWATMIVVATWPLLLHAQGWLGGRRSLAVAYTLLVGWVSESSPSDEQGPAPSAMHEIEE